MIVEVAEEEKAAVSRWEFTKNSVFVPAGMETDPVAAGALASAEA
jgi:hypothetical protein